MWLVLLNSLSSLPATQPQQVVILLCLVLRGNLRFTHVFSPRPSSQREVAREARLGSINPPVSNPLSKISDCDSLITVKPFGFGWMNFEVETTA